MKSTYFIALYMVALALLAFMFYLSIGTTGSKVASEGIAIRFGGYVIGAWGIVIGVLGLGMALLYFQVRKKFMNRFPRPKKRK
ncbi:MAG TPA: hypothetical protein VKN36_09040 [Eudoraea sp.]|nr:hypothetical protein [Eudoraea sp.]